MAWTGGTKLGAYELSELLLGITDVFKYWTMFEVEHAELARFAKFLASIPVQSLQTNI